MKLLALYATPKDSEAFEKAYFETHVPLIEKVPGLLSVKVTRINRVVVGKRAPYMVTEMEFADKEARKAGLNSPEMAAAGENLDSFAEGLYTLCFAEDK
ncbi:MAG: EthD family reductase [Chloroflexi bacterium]|nr:MAG: EthD family reductase [Chloroflexota bacterium]MBL1193590.1 EthD family reductase [Chloroflexota bacterium]NOH10881.1 EthD family reductase [Chloroflexota bacterium]